MLIILVARKFGNKYHYWVSYGPYKTTEEAQKDARESGFVDYMITPLLESPELIASAIP